ncbi:sugar phosphorylase [Candidatus Villigracilis affinis]|uniref:sugar phosphorylase n=1 Tax=Candidatus Villigracilis affinis TaxID=3140682 RepID=UPI002A1AA7DD|nr:sugar phosphorylase [Anaerolineales bacterium]
MTKKLLDHLTFLYGENESTRLLERTKNLLSKYRPRIKSRNSELSEQDSILITYGDQIQASNEKPLQTLRKFCEIYLTDTISGIHILPFYPWTSDDGFSVVDYRQIDPALGNWNDVSAMQNFRLMFDGVINHISSQSEWFQGFLHDDSNYRDYFITVEGDPNLSQVVRPRALPLLTTFKTASGEKKVWTTFSEDQIDLNFKNSEVLLEILDVLLMYIEHGATFIRLDAIAYLWKEIGTTCIHLPQTHHVIQFLRATLTEIAPHVHLITETNVPHVDNISYFGDGTNEAQLVYNFALPPLTLHTFHTGDARVLSNWAKTLTLPSDKTTFFNFLASHDGIGINPTRGILSNEEINALINKTLEHGGLISYKHNADGTHSPYEMNINYFDALSNPNANEPISLQINRFIAAQAIMLSLIGMPGIYFHSLFGSRGWLEGVKQTGRNRTINREKLQLDELQNELADENSLRSRVFAKYSQLLKIRNSSSAFHPHGAQTIMDVHPSVFAIERTSPDGASRVLCLHNVSGQIISFSTGRKSAIDLFTGQVIQVSNVTLQPYQVEWLKTN